MNDPFFSFFSPENAKRGKEKETLILTAAASFFFFFFSFFLDTVGGTNATQK